MSGRLQSMTGFADIEGETASVRWRWEVKSVNGRGLELRFRLPPGFERVEPALRARLSKTFQRGSIFSALHLRTDGARDAFIVSEDGLAAAANAIARVQAVIDCDPPRPERVLSLRGVLETQEAGEKNREEIETALLAGFDEAVTTLAAARVSEGEAIQAVFADMLDRLDALRARADALKDASTALLRTRLSEQLAPLLDGDAVSQERLAQEAAMLAVRADIREEVDRLGAHIDAARALVKKGSPVGRQLDFLIQELNREANTLCAKAVDMEMKTVGLDLKNAIDQLREQAQNIE